jgi:uncharacterized protein with HEPN domain
VTEDPDLRDRKRVADMLAHAIEAVGYAEGMTEAGFRASRLHQRAATYALTIVGEAAYKVSKAYRDRYPHIPWAVIIGMRHKLIHDYGGVATQVVWTTVRDDVPDLIVQLRLLLGPDEAP